INLKTTRNDMSNLPSNLFQPLVIILACLIILVSKMPQLKFRKTILFLALGSLTLICALAIFGFFN
ncbi:hypothetical protein RG114_003856, partial [Acinetobacter baumannii]